MNISTSEGGTDRMIKKLLIALILLAGGHIANAQGALGRISIIPKLGVSVANTTDTKVATGHDGKSIASRYSGGLAAGFDIEYTVSRQIGIALGAYYATEGSKFPDLEVFQSDSKSTGYHNWHTDLHYINVPLVGNYYLLPGLAIKTGIQTSFLAEAKEKSERTAITTDRLGAKQYGSTEQHKTALRDKLRRVDFSIPVGFSYEYMNVILDIRYNIGLTNIYTGELSDTRHSKNRFLTFTAGYRFGL